MGGCRDDPGSHGCEAIELTEHYEQDNHRYHAGPDENPPTQLSPCLSEAGCFPLATSTLPLAALCLFRLCARPLSCGMPGPFKLADPLVDALYSRLKCLQACVREILPRVCPRRQTTFEPYPLGEFACTVNFVLRLFAEPPCGLLRLALLVTRGLRFLAGALLKLPLVLDGLCRQPIKAVQRRDVLVIG